MTLIWATQINDKWTLVVDSAVTIWQVMTDTLDGYRPKLREIKGKNVTLITAGCGAIKDVDFVLNIVENKLANRKFKSTNDLKFFLQETVSNAHRELKTLTDDPQEAFIFLEPKTNTLWIVDEYSITEPKFCANIAMGSGEQMFYKARKHNDFFSAFIHAVECDAYCDFPVVSYRDGELNTWYWYGPKEDNRFYSLGHTNEPEEKLCSCWWEVPEVDPKWRRAYICDWTSKTL